MGELVWVDQGKSPLPALTTLTTCRSSLNDNVGTRMPQYHQDTLVTTYTTENSEATHHHDAESLRLCLSATRPRGSKSNIGAYCADLTTRTTSSNKPLYYARTCFPWARKTSFTRTYVRMSFPIPLFRCSHTNLASNMPVTDGRRI